MKEFDIEFSYTANGIITVKAKTAEEAAAKVAETLGHGLPHGQDVYYTDSKGEVEFVHGAYDETVAEVSAPRTNL
jgi:hypothetical protein